MEPDTPFKLLGVFVYLAALLVIGAIASRRMHSVRDYYAGGKKMGFLAVAFSARATGESGWLLLGLTGMGAALGVRAFWVVLGEVLGVALAWMVLSRRFKRLTDRYDSLTIPDYLESRFQDGAHRIRLVAAGALAVFVTIYISAQLHATGDAFHQFLGWDYTLGVLVGFAVVGIYSISGGFLAVVWSDVFQGTLMVLGLTILPIVGLVSIGGFGALGDRLLALDPSLMSWSGNEGVASIFGIIALLAVGLGFLGSPQIFVRFLSLRSEDEIRNGTAVALIWTLLADSGAVLIGLLGRALLTDPGTALADSPLGGDGEGVLQALVMDQLPWLEGVFIAIVLAAIMSTVDSLLVLASSAVVRDVHQKIRHPDLPDDALVPASRKATFVLALIALGVALGVAEVTGRQSVFWYVIFGWSGIAATFCPAIVLSLFWRGMTARGTLAAMITGFFSVPFFKFVVPHLPGIGATLGTLEELAPSFLAAGIAGIVFSWLDPVGRARLAHSAAEDLDFAGGSPPRNDA